MKSGSILALAAASFAVLMVVLMSPRQASAAPRPAPAALPLAANYTIFPQSILTTPTLPPTATPTVTPTGTSTGTASPAATLTATATSTPGCIAFWKATSSPNFGPLSDWLNGVSALSANNVWAVGYYVTGSGGGKNTLIEHWNGASWDRVPSPNIGDESFLNAVSALSPNDVWAVGHYRGAFFIDHTLVQHWDGTRWSIVPSPDGDLYHSALRGVSALSPNDVWAVGYANVGRTYHTLTVHWNGSRWDAVPSPNGGPETNALDAVTVISPNDVVATGYYYDAGTGGIRALAEHWDGTQWSVVPTPLAGPVSELTAVFGIAPNDVWAVGYYRDSGPDRTLVEHWDGIEWRIAPSPNIGDFGNDLFGVSGTVAGDVWAAGYYYDEHAYSRTLIMHWEHGAWSVQSSPNPASWFNDLQAVSAVSDHEVWVAGQSFSTGGETQTLLERYTDTCATPAPTSTPLATPTACNISFTDVPADSAYYSFTRCLSCMGIISGYSDGTFRPNNTINRGQLAKIVANAAGFSDPPGAQIFEDVPPAHAFFIYIQRLATRGYISGYACGAPGEPCVLPGNRPYFRPANDLTRGQLAKVVANATGIHYVHPFQVFEDVPSDHPFYTYTQMLGSRLIMEGYSCGGSGEPCIRPFERKYFRPSNTATRGQTAKIVANAFFPDCDLPAGKQPK